MSSSGRKLLDSMEPMVRWKAWSCGIARLEPMRRAPADSSSPSEPNTDWLQSSGLKLDGRGFVLTGGDERLPLETNKRGIFAVGDVRSGSVKRVAASVGDGAQVVAAIHQYLAAQEKERPVSIQPQMQVTAAE